MALSDDDHSGHPDCTMGHAVVRILSRLNVSKRNRESVAGTGLQVAGEGAGVVRHVCCESFLRLSGKALGVESDVVRSAGDENELHRVTRLDGQTRRGKTKALLVADHLHDVNASADGRGRNGG